MDNADGVEEQAGLRSGKAGAVADLGEILTWGAKGQHMDGRDGPAVQLGDVPQVGHVREVPPCDGDGGGLDLAGPQGDDPAAERRQREHADPVKQAPQGERIHRAPFPATSGHFVQRCPYRSSLASLPLVGAGRAALDLSASRVASAICSRIGAGRRASARAISFSTAWV